MQPTKFMTFQWVTFKNQLKIATLFTIQEWELLILLLVLVLLLLLFI